ncbi:MAG: DUF2341 domain-containing protein [Candidatus Aenigmatarchaeota archaeon]
MKIALLFLLLLLLLPIIFSDINCGIFYGTCPSGNIDLLYLRNDTGGYNNAHAQLPTVGYYPYVLCCNSTTQTLGRESSGTPFLKLYSQTDSHVQDPSNFDLNPKYTHLANISGSYSNPVCQLSDDYCPSGYGCLVSIAGDKKNRTNAHVGECGYYRKKVCCSDNIQAGIFYSLNSTNSTIAGTAVRHNLKWTSSEGLSGYIFQFCNGTWNGTHCMGDGGGWGEWSSELLTNPGAESGTTGWTSYGGGTFVSGYCSSCDDPPRSGSSMFSWNDSTDENTKAAQNVSLSSYSSYISQGKAVIDAGCWIISNEYHDDPPWDMSMVNVTFYDSTGNRITTNSYSSGWVNSETWTWRGLNNTTIPSNAAIVSLEFGSMEEGWDAGSVDDCSVRVRVYYSGSGWVNDTWTPMTGTENWSNVTKIVNSTVGATIAWCVYANDTLNNWNGTSCLNPFTYITTLEMPPSINQIQCAINSTTNWQSCSDVKWNDTITRIRVNCTSLAGIKNLTYNLTNIPDMNNTIYSINASSVDQDWWIYDNNDLLIEDSGYWNLSIKCMDTSNHNSTDNVTWFVPWGYLDVSLVTPTTNTNVSQNKFFTFTSSVTCRGGECGDVDATLDPPENWWNTSFKYRQKLTFTKWYGSSNTSNLTDFPILVKLNPNNFNYSRSPTGTDLRFIDSDNTTVLPYERELWNTSGDSFIWVKVPLLENTSTDYIWMYFNASVEDGENKTGVWDQYFKGVWHLNETSGTRYDSTGKNNLTDSNGVTRVTGNIGGMAYFEQDNRQSLNITDSDQTGLDFTNSFTFMAITKRESNNDYNSIISKGNYDVGQFSYMWFIGWLGSVKFRASSNGVVFNIDCSSDFDLTTDGTHSILFLTYNGSVLRLYKDGEEVNSGDFPCIDNDTIYNSNAKFIIGGLDSSGGDFFDGTIDEVRVSNISRSSSWINASYLTMTDNLITYGPEEGVSTGIKYGPVSTTPGDKPFYTINSNPQKCINMKYLGTNQTCQTSWQVNATGDLETTHEFYVLYNLTKYSSYVNSNETNHINITISQLGYLEVILVSPSSTQNIIQNKTFAVNATVYCRDSECGNVYGTLRYNSSSANPDTPVSSNQGDKPFFIQDGSPLKSCPTNPLSKDEFCNITWTINASGDVGSEWKVGVLFNSSFLIENNHTGNSSITIIGCIPSMTLQFSSITFGPLLPKTNQNPAIGNSNREYNITVNYGSCSSDLWIKGEDLTNTTLGYTIGIGNLSWNLLDDYLTSENMTKEYTLLYHNPEEEKNITTYYWLNTPLVAAGSYRGNITIKINESG